VLYSRSHCSHCADAKKLLKRNQIWAEIIDLDRWNNEAAFFDVLENITGSNRCPYLFVAGKYYGDALDMQKGEKDGSLAKVLDKAGIEHALGETPSCDGGYNRK
jgi:glutaredoxin